MHRASTRGDLEPGTKQAPHGVGEHATREEESGAYRKAVSGRRMNNGIPDGQRIVVIVSSSEADPADPIHFEWTIGPWCRCRRSEGRYTPSAMSNPSDDLLRI